MNKKAIFKSIVLISIISGGFISPLKASKGLVPADSTYTIKASNITMVINAAVGGRIVSLKIDGEELLTDKNIHPKFYGSTLWLSPEGKWKGQGILDDGLYKVDDFNGKILHLSSAMDTLRGFSFTKRFKAVPKDTAITIHYTITNIADKMQEVSAWEVTRVHTGGIAFYPKGATSALPKTDLPVKEVDDIIWYPYDSSKVNHQKLYWFGAEGWEAYVNKGILFIKQFPLIKPDQTAPGEVNAEIYVNKNKTYMELENQGRFTALKHGELLNFEVKWYVRHLPPGIEPVVGNPLLLKYIRSVLKIKPANTK